MLGVARLIVSIIWLILTGKPFICVGNSEIEFGVVVFRRFVYVLNYLKFVCVND